MRSLLCLAMALAAATPAASQDQSQIGAANRAEAYRNNMAVRRGDYVATRQRNDARSVERTAEREALAERLATMANGGECRRAIAIARREGEAEIADRLARMCRTSS